MKCSTNSKRISGYIHLVSVLIIAIFTFIQIYSIEKHKNTRYWIPIAIIITILLHLPNLICLALNEWHGWYTIIGSILAIILNSYLIYHLANTDISIKVH